MFNTKIIEQIEERLDDVELTSRIAKETSFSNEQKINLIAKELGFEFVQEDYISYTVSGMKIKQRPVLKKIGQSPEGNNTWKMGTLDNLGKMFDGVMMSFGTGSNIKTKTKKKVCKKTKKQ